jgi:hypothetical protein
MTENASVINEKLDGMIVCMETRGLTVTKGIDVHFITSPINLTV